MIAPYYPESVANEVLSTVGGVRFIKWAQDSLVSFAEDVSNIMLFVLQTSLFLFEVLLMFSNVYISI